MLELLRLNKAVSLIVLASLTLYASEPRIVYKYGQEVASIEGVITKKIVKGPSKTGTKGDLSPQTMYFFVPSTPISMSEGVDSLEQPACENVASITCYFENNDIERYYKCIGRIKIKISGVLRSRLRGWSDVPVSIVVRSFTVQTSLD